MVQRSWPPSAKRKPPASRRGCPVSTCLWLSGGSTAGETSAAAELLRQSIRAATSAGHKDAHAKARLALGDLAQAGGDPVTACEHWQIARSLFRELRRSREHDAVEARMRRNGCPTDWVLTDF